MRTIHCPTKDKTVLIYETRLNAGTLENPSATISGRVVCAEKDYLCDHKKCPLQKGNT